MKVAAAVVDGVAMEGGASDDEDEDDFIVDDNSDSEPEDDLDLDLDLDLDDEPQKPSIFSVIQAKQGKSTAPPTKARTRWRATVDDSKMHSLLAKADKHLNKAREQGHVVADTSKTNSRRMPVQMTRLLSAGKQRVAAGGKESVSLTAKRRDRDLEGLLALAQNAERHLLKRSRSSRTAHGGRPGHHAPLPVAAVPFVGRRRRRRG
jgi:hypothetical protein